MVGNYIVIRFKGELASLHDKYTIEISQLFAKDFFLAGLIATRPCHLQVEVKKYIESENELLVRIVSYNEEAGQFTYLQNENQNLLTKITSIRITGGSETMSLYAMGLKDSPSKKPKLKYDQVKLPIEDSKKPIESKIKKHQLTLNINFSIKKLTFDKGCVFFEYKITELDSKVEIVVENGFIDPVHDSIKPYFSKILELEKINVNVTIEYSQNTDHRSSIKTITDLKASSNDIDRITPELIERVKYKYLKNKIRQDNLNEKSLLTKEEFLQLNDGSENIKELYESDEALLEALTNVTQTKHHQHLLFLSEIHDHKTMRLRFIPRPISFMFLVNGESKDYFVWETSDTKEATYVWSNPIKDIEKRKPDLMKRLGEIDLIITRILNEGKNQYIEESEEGFTRVRHTYLDNSDGFNRWKKDLLNTII